MGESGAGIAGADARAVRTGVDGGTEPPVVARSRVVRVDAGAAGAGVVGAEVSVVAVGAARAAETLAAGFIANLSGAGSSRPDAVSVGAGIVQRAEQSVTAQFAHWHITAESALATISCADLAVVTVSCAQAAHTNIARFVAKQSISCATWLPRADSLVAVVVVGAELFVFALIVVHHVHADVVDAGFVRTGIAVVAIQIDQTVGARVEGLVADRSRAAVAGSLADAVAARIRGRAKQAVVARRGIHQVLTRPTHARLIGAGIVVVAVAGRQTLHAGVSPFIAVRASRIQLGAVDHRSGDAASRCQIAGFVPVAVLSVEAAFVFETLRAAIAGFVAQRTRGILCKTVHRRARPTRARGDVACLPPIAIRVVVAVGVQKATHATVIRLVANLPGAWGSAPRARPAAARVGRCAIPSIVAWTRVVDVRTESRYAPIVCTGVAVVALGTRQAVHAIIVDLVTQQPGATRVSGARAPDAVVGRGTKQPVFAGIRIVARVNAPRRRVARVVGTGIAVVAGEGRPRHARPGRAGLGSITGVAVAARVGVVVGVHAPGGRTARIIGAGVVVVAGRRRSSKACAVEAHFYTVARVGIRARVGVIRRVHASRRCAT